MASDAAGPAVHQQQLAFAQVSGHHQVRPHRARHFGKPGRVHQVDTVRNRQHLTGGNGDVFGVSAAGQQRANFLSHRPSGDIRADFGDDAGDLHADDLAGARRWRVFTGGLQHVGAVDTGRGDFDQHLARPRGHVGYFLPEQLIGGFGDDGMHAGHATTAYSYQRWRGRAA